MGISRRMLPVPLRHWLWTRWYRQPYSPLPGHARLGSLHRLTPFSREFGYDRGRPIDRYYIEKFLLAQQEDVRGRVLEIADNQYTRQFGGRRVTQSDVLHVSPAEPNATMIGDLTHLDHVPSDTFDCVILTQTLQVIYDVRAALESVYRILKPGGVILATFPGISPISRYDMERWGYYWGFTSLSARRLFAEVFPERGVQVEACGNVLAATAFLYGMATEELRQEELEYADPDYEVIIAVRARKPDAA
jgi:SAM-dependent methyltransferase